MQWQAEGTIGLWLFNTKAYSDPGEGADKPIYILYTVFLYIYISILSNGLESIKT